VKKQEGQVRSRRYQQAARIVSAWMNVQMAVQWWLAHVKLKTSGPGGVGECQDDVAGASLARLADKPCARPGHVSLASVFEGVQDATMGDESIHERISRRMRLSMVVTAVRSETPR
jgi:hypothetical protein